MTAPLVEKILALDAALRAAGLPHAFGGALALAYHVAEPRATRDIDLNVFVPVVRAREVFAWLPPGVAWNEHDVVEATEHGQVRVLWGDAPVDLFLSTHRFHDHAQNHVVEVPLAGSVIPVLGATELAVFKVFFDRTRDWADVEAMLAVSAIDIHRALGWLVDLVGGGDHRVGRFRALLDRPPPPEEDPTFAP